MWESEDFNEYLLTEEGAVVRSMACAIEDDTLTFTREAIGNLTLRAALDAHREKLGLPKRISEALIPPPPPPPPDGA